MAFNEPFTYHAQVIDLYSVTSKEPELRVAAKPEVAVKYVFAAYKWIVVAPFLAFSTLIIGLIIMPLCLIGLPNFASRVFATAWARLNSAVSILSVELQGAEHIAPKQSYIIVANHQSLIDIYAVYGFLGVDFKWVMKKNFAPYLFLVSPVN